MTELRLRFIPRAVEQLETALDWWRSNRDRSPELLADEFQGAIEGLRRSPTLGAEYPNDELPDARRFLLRRTRFHIYYVVRDDTLVVAAIWGAIRGHGPNLDG